MKNGNNKKIQYPDICQQNKTLAPDTVMYHSDR